MRWWKHDSAESELTRAAWIPNFNYDHSAYPHLRVPPDISPSRRSQNKSVSISFPLFLQHVDLKPSQNCHMSQ